LHLRPLRECRCDLLLAFQLALQRFVDRHPDGVDALRRRDDPFGFRELHRRRKRLQLMHGAGLGGQGLRSRLFIEGGSSIIPATSLCSQPLCRKNESTAGDEAAHCAALERGGPCAPAIRRARRLLQLDLLREATYLSLMRLHLLQGEHAGALRASHECAAPRAVYADLLAGQHGAGGGKHRTRPVARGFHDCAVIDFDQLPQERIVLGQGGLLVFRVALPEIGAGLEVGKFR
jgi:hypothetical protein